MTASRFSFYSLTTVVASLGVAVPAGAQTAPAPGIQTSNEAPNAVPTPPNSSASPEPDSPDAPEEAAQPPLETPPPYPVVPDDPIPPEAQEPPVPEPASAAQQPAIHEPPLPQPYRGASGVTPIPPPEPLHVAPRTSFWAGVRPTLTLPLGSMWTDREPEDYYCCTQNPRPFSEFATPGPGLELDVGMRFARNYQVFAFGEYAFLGAGPLDDAFGGQGTTTTSVFGLGVRFSTHPDSLGFLIEMSLGYRSFEATWKDGTKLSANDDLFSTRLGIGGIWQVNDNMSVDLLFVLGGGSFTDIEWTFADGSSSGALSGYDDRGQYIPLGFQLGVHWDIVRSKD